MRDSYLLAVGLLSGLALPASALPQISNILPDSSNFPPDAKQSAQKLDSAQNNINAVESTSEFSNKLFKNVESLSPKIDDKNLPSLFNISLPEFGGGYRLNPESSQTTATNNNLSNSDTNLPQFSSQQLSPSINTFFNLNSESENIRLTNGSQLYYYRLSALKTGQIYTRQDTENEQLLRDAERKQQLTYDDWKSLLALEAKAIAQGQGKNRLSILVGDSLSMWFPREKLPSGKLWLNQGISGDTSTGIANRLGVLGQTRPEAIYIMAGINDLRKGASDEVILRNHRRILRNLRQSHPKTQIFLQSILPTDLPTIPNSRIRQLNGKLAEIAQEEKVNYLNIHHWFTDSQGNLRTDLTTDGLHLSAAGYDVWRFAIQQVEYKLSQSKNVDR